MDDIHGIFGSHLRELRKQKKLSQEKLAELCSLTPQFLSEVERGNKSPSLDTLYKLAKGLQIPLVQLLSIPELAETPREELCALIDEYDSEQQVEILKALRALLKKD